LIAVTGYQTKSFAIAILALSLATSVVAAPPAIEAYGRLPALIDVDINPAGSRLVLIENDGSESRIVIQDLTAKKILRKITVPAGQKLHAVHWANDDTILISQSITRSLEPGGRDTDEWQRWTAIDAAAGKDRLLLMTGDREWVTGAHLVRRQTAMPGKIFMSTLDFSVAKYRSETGTRLAGGKKDSGWTSNLYEVDLASGDGRIIVSGTPFTDAWLVDESASRIVRSDWNTTQDRYEIKIKEGLGWRSLYSAAGCGRMSLVALTADKTGLVTSGKLCGEERIKLWLFPFDGSPGKPILEDAALDVENVRLDPLDQQLLGATLSGSEQEMRWTDARAEHRSAALRRTFVANEVSLIGRSSDYKRVVVLTENATHPPIYYLVDFIAKTAEIINEKYPLLNGVKLGAVQEFHYEARDKYALMAYLTLPPDAADKNLPMVILPHGGPEARDDNGFNWLAQFLASRGYAVLQPQFRGSSGFGRAHADAGRHQWGLRMQDDVTDGVRAVVDKGIADPGRICIVGWSYGGYAALAGAAFTPDLYRCAASIAGVSDLPVMLRHTAKSDGKESDSLAYWREHIGSSTDPQVIAKSPARSAATISAPILLLHGTDDTVVPIVQSQMMARALDAAHKPYSFVELPGDDHNLYTSAMRIRMLTELEKFLAQHLAAAPATPSAN
jgi:dipeptidyl aminopeptidase/acylaminoacyl peptidase